MGITPSAAICPPPFRPPANLPQPFPRHTPATPSGRPAPSLAPRHPQAPSSRSSRSAPLPSSRLSRRVSAARAANPGESGDRLGGAGTGQGTQNTQPLAHRTSQERKDLLRLSLSVQRFEIKTQTWRSKATSGSQQGTADLSLHGSGKKEALLERWSQGRREPPRVPGRQAGGRRAGGSQERRGTECGYRP